MQRGADQPLCVFEREFAIGVVLSIAPGRAARARRPSRRGCAIRRATRSMCYIPTTCRDGVDVARSRRPRPRRGTADVFDAIAFGTGDDAGDASAPARDRVPRAGAASGARDSGRATRSRRSTASSMHGTTFGYLGVGRFPDVHPATPRTACARRGMFEGRGPLAILLLVLLGGLALNLTPCVLPMIPINLAIIGAGAQAGSRSRGFLLGGAYGAAMAVVYGVLGLIVVLTASTFGTINASPWFNLGIAVALRRARRSRCSTCIVIDFSRFSNRIPAWRVRPRIVPAWRSRMGAVAALLAGACVAPVVIQVVLFSSNLYATGTTAALALPFLLGVGMAIPWPIAGAGIAALPEAGRVDGPHQAGLRRHHPRDRGLLRLRGLQPLLRTAGWMPTEVSSSVEEKLKAGWHAVAGRGLAVAERENKPVLIDMWATWCKNCLVMDKTTLEDADGRRRARGLREGQIPGRRPRRPARREGDAAHEDVRSADLRHHETEAMSELTTRNHTVHDRNATLAMPGGVDAPRDVGRRATRLATVVSALLIAGLTGAACSSATEPPAAPAAQSASGETVEQSAPKNGTVSPSVAGVAPAGQLPAGHPGNVFTGAIVESMDSSGYTYARLTSDSSEIRIAAPEFKPVSGEVVSVALDMPMENFESKTLKRTFPMLYFVADIARNGQPARSERRLRPDTCELAWGRGKRGAVRDQAGASAWRYLHRGRLRAQGLARRQQSHAARYGRQVQRRHPRQELAPHSGWLRVGRPAHERHDGHYHRCGCGGRRRHGHRRGRSQS